MKTDSDIHPDDKMYLLCADDSQCLNCSMVEDRNGKLEQELAMSKTEQQILFNHWSECDTTVKKLSEEKSQIQEQFLKTMNTALANFQETLKIQKLEEDKKFNDLHDALIAQKLELKNSNDALIAQKRESDEKFSNLQEEFEEKLEKERKNSNDALIAQKRESDEKFSNLQEEFEEKLEKERKNSNDALKELQQDIDSLYQFTVIHYYYLASEVLNHFIGWTGEEFEVKRFSHANPAQVAIIKQCLEHQNLSVEIFQDRANQLVTYGHRLMHINDIADLKSKIADALAVSHKVVSKYPNDTLLIFALLVLELNDNLLATI